MQKRQFLQLFPAISLAPVMMHQTMAEAAATASNIQDQSQNTRGAKKMTGNELKAIVRRFNVEVIQDGKRASFDELMDSEFINKSAPEGTPAGPESLWDFFQNVLRPALSNFQVTIHDQIAEADKVTTRKTFTGTHTGPIFGIAPTGRQVTIDAIDIIRVRNGKYFEHWGQNSLPSVLAALRAG